MVPTVVVPSSVTSITLDTFPVDTIDTPTPCALHTLYNRKGKTIQVASGTDYPGCTMNSDILPDKYVRVEVLSVSPNHLD
jgi:hypothetical protein